MLAFSLSVQIATISRTQLTGCYSDYSSFTFNRNLATFTVTLIPSGNKSCAIFPPGVAANLTLASTPFYDSLGVIINNFDYYQTLQIVFSINSSVFEAGKDLDDFVDETFAVLHIFSYSEITQLELMIFDELKSDLSSCFKNSNLKVTSAGVELLTTPTGVCKLQMVVKDPLNPAQNSYINDIAVSVNNQKFELPNLSDFLTNYSTDTNISFSVNGDTSTIRQTAYTTASLQIQSVQGGLEISLTYPVSNITIASTANFFNPLQAFVILSNYTILAKFDMNLAIQAAFMAQLALTPYTKVVYRLTAQVGSNTFTHQISKTAPFNPNLRLLFISCSDGSENEQELCTNFYKIALDNTEVLWSIDILFYNDKDFVSLETTNLNILTSCFDKVTIQERDQELCASVIRRENITACTQLFNGPLNMVLQIYEEENLLDQGQHRMIKPYSSIGANETQFCFTCTDADTECKTALSMAGKSTSIYNLVVLNATKTTATPTQKIVKDNYKGSNLTPQILGGLILVASAVACILGILTTLRNIKMMKSKKNKL
ncbi:Conserved_hypothetical protein [Hexamita inflata]|uniref:Uncharacterized protein n=1 Tax=Hexamita inflata TaxID=28002 RepID=A0AA86NDT5_9EUKA|nr:Conserved hypothetical protein [Hexamita inflata]